MKSWRGRDLLAVTHLAAEVLFLAKSTGEGGAGKGNGREGAPPRGDGGSR